jgi:hypothetical protein
VLKFKISAVNSTKTGPSAEALMGMRKKRKKPGVKRLDSESIKASQSKMVLNSPRQDLLTNDTTCTVNRSQTFFCGTIPLNNKTKNGGSQARPGAWKNRRFTANGNCLIGLLNGNAVGNSLTVAVARARFG